MFSMTTVGEGETKDVHCLSALTLNLRAVKSGLFSRVCVCVLTLQSQ